MLFTALGAAIAAASCSDDQTKKVPSVGAAGAAGAAGEAGASESGGSGGSAGSGKIVGPNVSAGAAGTPESGGAGGAVGQGGAPPIDDGSFILFTVDAAALGLSGSALASVENPQSKIFASGTFTGETVKGGTNELRVSGARLGIADTDAIDAFAAVQPTPVTPLYWFSVKPEADGEGVSPTRLSFSSAAHEAAGDVYFSDGTLSYRNLGEGSDLLGYNALVADEQSLGLQPLPEDRIYAHEDNLTGVQLVADGIMPSELYFSVGPGSTGLDGSAVAATAEADRACTIFKSELEGTNTVAFTCADLGLATNSDVTGLVLYGVRAPTDVLFTISSTSSGLAETAVASATPIANNIFESPLDGTNTLRVDGPSLGLNSTDEIDALTAVDQSPDSYAYGATCALSPSPLGTDSPDGANLANFGSARGLGDHLLFIQGPTATPPASAGPAATDNVAVYNLKTCAFIAKTTIPTGIIANTTWAPVPLAGWSESAPLANLEYWNLGPDGSYVDRLDATGTVLKSFPLIGVPVGIAAISLMYEPMRDHFYGVLTSEDSSLDYTRIYFPRPAATLANGTGLNALVTPLYHPCSYGPALSGTDQRGNSVFTQIQRGSTEERVCSFTPGGEFDTLPSNWTLQTETADVGVLVPGTAFYAIFPDNGFNVERYDLR
jgi:hypothetical protein